MSVRRTVVLGVVGGAIAVWLAAAATSTTRTAAPIAPPKTNAVDRSGAELAAEIARLHEALRNVLGEWTERLRAEAGPGFPAKVTAFHEGMAVHGRHGKPCPMCGAPVQRIVYAENETNYCARCQTGGRILADRALSRLLKKTFPRSIDELE